MEIELKLLLAPQDAPRLRAHPLLAQCVRITVGAPEQNDAVLALMRALYEK